MPKNFMFIYLIIILLMLGGYYLGYTAKEREIKQQLFLSSSFENPIFIWNDDLESIPKDGSPITLEFTVKDTIYIGPAN